MARLVTVEGDCLFSLQLPGFGAVELGWSGDRPTLTRLELDSDPSGPVIASSRDAGHVNYAPPGGEAGLLDYPMLAGVAVLCDHDAIRWQGHEFRYTVLDWLCADPEAAGVILLVAMVGAIVLTHREGRAPRGQQNISKQNARRPGEATVMRQPSVGEGIEL